MKTVKIILIFVLFLTSCYSSKGYAQTISFYLQFDDVSNLRKSAYKRVLSGKEEICISKKPIFHVNEVKNIKMREIGFLPAGKKQEELGELVVYFLQEDVNKLNKITKQYQGKRIAVFIDDRHVTTAIIREPIFDVFSLIMPLAQLREKIKENITVSEESIKFHDDHRQILVMGENFKEALRGDDNLESVVPLIYTEPQKAKEAILRILAEDEGNGKANFYAGYIFLLEGEYGTAINYFETALQLVDAVEKWHIELMLSKCYAAIGNYEKAEEILRDGIKRLEGLKAKYTSPAIKQEIQNRINKMQLELKK